MAYTIRRWLSSSGILFDDSKTVKTAEDAIKTAQSLAGIMASVITDDIKDRIRAMEPGEVIKIKKSSLKLTLRVKRLTK